MFASKILIVLTGITTLAVAAPSTLEARANQLTISYCNWCTGGRNGADCHQANFIHWGDTSRLGSCNDSQIPMDDDQCEAYGQIQTPVGYGDWSLIEYGCNAQRNQLKGQIATSNGNYLCYQAGGDQFTNYCGLTYACTLGLVCYGP